MAPKNQSEVPKSEPAAAGVESTHPPVQLDGLTILQWAERAKKAERQYDRLDKDLNEQVRKLIGVEDELAIVKKVVSPQILEMLAFRLESDTRAITLVDRECLKQAESAIGALSQWLAGQRSAMAKLLGTEYPAVRILHDKVTFGNGVYAPQGMVYSRELHPTQFASIVAQKQPDIDFVWESSVKP
jgi:hypothetical protein